MKTVNKVLDAVAALIVLCGVLFLAIYLLGIRPFIVLSGSMEPEIKTGSVVFVDIRDAASVKPGDVIAFSAGGNAVTHRVSKIKDGTIITKGDANNDVDGESIKLSCVIGRVIYSVPFLGFVISSLRTPLAVVLILLIFAAHVILTVIIDEKEKYYEQES